MAGIRLLRDAYQLYLTDSEGDTIIAGILLLSVVTPLIIRLYRSQVLDY